MASCSFLLEESKIAPHSVSLLAERSVFSFVFFEGHGILFYQGRQIEQLAALSDVPALGAPEHSMLSGGFVDVPAIEIPGLLALDEFADRIASEMLPFGRAIERGVFGRGVANQNQRIESRKSLSRRSLNSCSLYSPGVSKGVGFE